MNKKINIRRQAKNCGLEFWAILLANALTAGISRVIGFALANIDQALFGANRRVRIVTGRFTCCAAIGEFLFGCATCRTTGFQFTFLLFLCLHRTFSTDFPLHTAFRPVQTRIHKTVNTPAAGCTATKGEARRRKVQIVAVLFRAQRGALREDHTVSAGFIHAGIVQFRFSGHLVQSRRAKCSIYATAIVMKHKSIVANATSHTHLDAMCRMGLVASFRTSGTTLDMMHVGWTDFFHFDRDAEAGNAFLFSAWTSLFLRALHFRSALRSLLLHFNW